MSSLSNLCDKSTDNTHIRENLILEENIQDDYKKLKQENDRCRQELHILRLKLETSYAFEKELQEANETLEQSLAQCTIKAEKMLAEKEEQYKAVREEYENHIADLETNIMQNVQQITELHNELKKYKNLRNEQLNNLISEDNLTPYKEKIQELTLFLQNERKEQEQLEKKLASMESQYQELEDILRITKEQLEEKDILLQNLREELAINRTELESLKIIPVNDICKGNSLFAEVEDRRQILLDKMKILQNKYNESKRALNTKMSEIKILKAEKATIVSKWEIDAIDTLQENSELLDKYKSRILDLENKLKIEIKKNQAVETQVTDDGFNYAQSLLVIKKRELEELNEKFEKQTMEMLAREEANYNISKQLRYWRSKAMSLEAQVWAIKAQLKKINNDDKTLEVIENCAIIGKLDFKKTYDLTATPVILDNKCRKSKGNLEISVIERCVNEQKEVDRKVLQFAVDTKHQTIKSKPLKEHDYPVISISDVL